MASTQKAGQKMMDEPETLDLFGGAAFAAPQPKSEPQKTETTAKTPTPQVKAGKAPVEKTTQKTPGKTPEKTTVVTVNDDKQNDVLAPVKKALKKKEPRSSRRKGPRKSDNAFKTISEVASQIGVPQHVLRFWETKFSNIKPMKRGGGRRYYRPEDVTLIERIHHLLYNEGYTIKGVQRLIKASSKAEFLAGEVGVQTVVVEKEVIKEVPAPTPTVTTGDTSTVSDEAMVSVLRCLRALRRELTVDE